MKQMVVKSNHWGWRLWYERWGARWCCLRLLMRRQNGGHTTREYPEIVTANISFFTLIIKIYHLIY